MRDLTAPRAPENVATRAVLLAAALLVGGLLFQQLVTLLLAILITIIIAIPLSACATRLERYGVPRWLGALVALVGSALVLAGILALIIPSFVDQVKQLVDAVPAIFQDLRDRFQEATGAKPSKAGTDVQTYLQRYVDDPEKLAGPISETVLGIAGGLASALLVIVTAYYVAVSPEPLVRGVLRVFPPRRREWARRVMDRLRTSYVGWLRGVAIHMVINFVLLYVGLSLIGLDFALVFAVLCAFLVVIPYFGSFVGGLVAVMFAFSDSPTKALLTLGVYVLSQQLEGNVIIPLVMSRTVKLHPAVIAVGVVVVGKLFGFVGLFVSVPILATIIILIEEVWVRGIEEHDARHVPEGLELPEGTELDLPQEPRAPAAA
jgi:predicted PurR-regulated permease PerM